MPCPPRAGPTPGFVRWFSAIVLAAALSVSAVARADTGDNERTSFYSGTRSFLHRNSIGTVNGGGGILFVRMQQNLTGSPSLDQIGWHRSLNIIDDCPSTGNLDAFIEWITTSAIGNCKVYSDSSGDEQFGMVNLSSGAGWQAYRNSLALGVPHDLGWSSGNPLVGGERHGIWVSVDGCWGCSGNLAWQVSTDHGNSYVNVSVCQSYADPGWSVVCPPSPFRIHN
jgi:hypothetical protein